MGSSPKSVCSFAVTCSLLESFWFDKLAADSLFSEVALTDGQIYAPSTFGQDDGGTWKAKEFADNVTFGNNGFYLTFQNASALGEDSSGNDNDFTLSNIASDHQVTDDVPPSV